MPLIFLLLLTFTCGSLSAATDTFKEKITETVFPTQVMFTDRGKSYVLKATGAAVRRKWFTNGYVIASYLKDPVFGDQEKVLNDIFSDDKAKQMTKIWLHRLPKKLIHDSYRESLRTVLTAPDYTKNEKDIDKFINFFSRDAEVGDRHYIRWMPGGDLELILNDEKQGTLINADLAKALWLIWLGPHSVVDRHDMLQFVLTK